MLHSGRLQSDFKESNNQLTQNQIKLQNKERMTKATKFLNGDFSSQIERVTVNWSILILHKVFRQIFDQITINDTELKQMKQLLNRTD